MFFSKFFKKDYGKLRGRGDAHFDAGRFADARFAYQEALESVQTASDIETERKFLLSRIALTGNRLAEMNIVEAEAVIRGGESKKGRDHLALALELADDVTIREKAEAMIATLHGAGSEENVSHKQGTSHGSHGCASCTSSHGGSGSDFTPDLSEQLQDDEQFQLLIHTLPGNLPQRYGALGEKFANAYLLAHSDQLQSALDIYKELLLQGENDILLCEIALLEYRLGITGRCESLLKKAMSIEESNPLVRLSLAQYYIDTRQLSACVPLLVAMMEQDILHDQAMIMLGDVYAMMGSMDSAIEIYTRGLQLPALKKVSAERLVQVLTSQNRTEEAAYLFKTYLKGCC